MIDQLYFIYNNAQTALFICFLAQDALPGCAVDNTLNSSVCFSHTRYYIRNKRRHPTLLSVV